MTDDDYDGLPLWFVLVVVLALFSLSVGLIGAIVYDRYQAKYVRGELETVDSTYRDYVVVSINRPKHFHVDLRDVKTGKVYTHIYVSKHCNKWRELQVGSTWRLRHRLLQYSISGAQVERIDTKPLYKEICK